MICARATVPVLKKGPGCLLQVGLLSELVSGATHVSLRVRNQPIAHSPLGTSEPATN